MKYILQHRELKKFVKDISMYETGDYVVYTDYREKALRFTSDITAQIMAKRLKCHLIEEEEENEHQ